MSSAAYGQFIARVREYFTAKSIEGLLEWDQETYMPLKGAETRGAHAALIAGVAHERLTSEEFGRLLEAVEHDSATDPVGATNVREMRRLYDRSVKLPVALVQAIARETALAKDAWHKAKTLRSFPLFAPHLGRLLELKREVAQRIGYAGGEPYDALMDEFEPGARAADVQRVFDDVKAELVPLVRAIAAAPRKPEESVLHRRCPTAGQNAFVRRVGTVMGFDFEAGRLDVSVHPFCQGLSPHDVRITTNYDEQNFAKALFGVMHEVGHALYEQGLDAAHAGTPAGTSVSLAIHESQSRLWENVVGRSRAFWQHWFAPLQADFPGLADVQPDDWYFAINTVKPSFIRIEADEVTYGLHVMLRFDLERQMIAGKINVADVPAAWNEAMRQFLGITPPDDAQGCLQDIHWSLGIFGYFPTYALGNLYAAQFYAAARRALPELDRQIAAGLLRPLRDWLQENIHRHGQRYRAAELVERVTGQRLSHRPYIDYLNEKFRPLYGC